MGRFNRILIDCIFAGQEAGQGRAEQFAVLHCLPCPLLRCIYYFFRYRLQSLQILHNYNIRNFHVLLRCMRG